jgi:hypothetical protein
VERRLEGREQLGARDEVGGVVGDPFNAVGVEHLGVHQPHLRNPEVLRDAERARDVDDVLGGDQDEDRIQLTRLPGTTCRAAWP